MVALVKASVYLTSEEIAATRETAEANGRSFSAEVRLALRQWNLLNQQQEREVRHGS